MNISDIFDGKAEQDVLDEVLAWGSSIIKSVENSPAVSSAFSSLQTNVMNDVSAVAEWAGTAADSALSVLGQEAQTAISSALTKYLATVGVSTTGPLGVAETVLIQGAISVLQASATAALTAALPTKS